MGAAASDSRQPWHEWAQLSEHPLRMGVWCPTCALPSRHDVQWLAATLSGPSTQPTLTQLTYRVVRYCENGCPPEYATNEPT